MRRRKGPFLYCRDIHLNTRNWVPLQGKNLVINILGQGPILVPDKQYFLIESWKKLINIYQTVKQSSREDRLWVFAVVVEFVLRCDELFARSVCSKEDCTMLQNDFSIQCLLLYQVQPKD